MTQQNILLENIFFIVVAVLLAFGIYQTLGTSLGTDTPVVSVVSNSMQPTFERGDLIMVRGTSYDDIDVGDIIVFKSRYDTIRDSMPPLIHRVIRKSSGTVDTKGDNNAGQIRYCLGEGYYIASNGCKQGEQLVKIEQDIEESQILGETFFIVPNLGYAKLVPTCLFLKLQLPDGHPQLDYMCGDLF